jgi:hypothetical protein
MNGTFNVLGSAYGVDPVSYNQRQHEERRKREELDARVARFLGIELNGQGFRSLEGFENAACAAAVAHRSRALSKEQHESIERVCTALWAGVLPRADIQQPYTRWSGILTIGEPTSERVA